MLSPFWGLIFILAYGEKYWNKKNNFYLIFVAVLVALFIGEIIETLALFDILIGVGLTSLLYFTTIHKTFDYLKTILTAFFLNVVYGLLRHLIFGKEYIQTFRQILFEHKELLITHFQDKPEQLVLVTEFIEKASSLFSKYYVGIGIATVTIALYLGSLLISKKSNIAWEHKKNRLPFGIVYVLIVSLGLLLIPKTSIIGGNLIIILIPLFLIQGSSILDFFWGNYFRKSKFLLILLIFSLVLNYYILLLIALIGMIDVWFDIRKIDSVEE